ncbi:MAG: KTSC domain-containing protein [Pseudomonadota bacterium]
MQRTVVPSSSISSIGYDSASETLEVEFQNGSVYQYYNVGQTIYDQIMIAPSKGQFLNSQIRNAFPYSRVG